MIAYQSGLFRMNMKRVLFLLLAAVLALGWSVSSIPIAEAAGETTLSFSPSEGTLDDANEDLDVAIQVTAADLYGAEVHLNYDPEVLEVIDEDTDTPGIQIEPGSILQQGANIPVKHEADAGKGEIVYAASLLGDRAGVEANEDTLFKVRFRLADEALSTTEVTWGKVILLDSDLNHLEEDLDLEPLTINMTNRGDSGSGGGEENGNVGSGSNGGGTGSGSSAGSGSGTGSSSSSSSGGNNNSGVDSTDEEFEWTSPSGEVLYFNDLQGLDADVIADILVMAEAGLMVGYSNANSSVSFRPYDAVKRAQVAKVISGALKLQPDAQAAERFPDVMAQVRNETDRGWIGALAKAGIATGYENGSFGPYDEVTRQQLASFFMRALGLDEAASQLYEAGVIRLDFRDASLVDLSHAANVALAAEIGFLQGREGGTLFDPLDQAFRSHVAKFGNQLYSEAEAFKAAAEALE